LELCTFGDYRKNRAISGAVRNWIGFDELIQILASGNHSVIKTIIINASPELIAGKRIRMQLMFAQSSGLPMIRFVICHITVVVLLLFALGGCTTVDDIGGYSGNDRANVPVPPKLVNTMKTKGMRLSDPVLVRIFKKESELELWKRDNTGKFSLLKTYPMCRWSGQLGPKKSEGDRQAPEGFYHVSQGMLNPASDYHLSFNLGFPNAYDSAYGRSGTALMVHGACTSSGCFAITNDGVGELYAVLRDALSAGQEKVQVQSFPFRMTPDNMAFHRANPNIEFWQNLEEGADHFEATRQPPKVAVCGKRYVFNAQFPESAALSASAACPSVVPDIAIAVAKDRKHTEHQTKIAALSQKSGAASVLQYADGGMHPSFQSVLRNKGAEALQKRTSSKNAPVSRPKEALQLPQEIPAAATKATIALCSQDAALDVACSLQ
jgi:murein L,D-transpeptidase YafK